VTWMMLSQLEGTNSVPSGPHLLESITNYPSESLKKLFYSL
jgi:hypothetical protein